VAGGQLPRDRNQLPGPGCSIANDACKKPAVLPRAVHTPFLKRQTGRQRYGQTT